MFCRMCGKSISNDSRFCQYCGTAVFTPSEFKPDKILAVTADDIKNGSLIEIQFETAKDPIKFNLPKNTVNHQLFRFVRIKTIDSTGKKGRRDFYLQIKITEK